MGKSIEDYQEYDGLDANIETSLFEYGLIWAKGIEGHKNDYHFIYGVGLDGETGEYNLFDWGDITVDVNPEEEWGFVDWDAVASFVGMTRDEVIKQPLPFLIHDLVDYYGTENIFGSSYYPFEIERKEKDYHE